MADWESYYAAFARHPSKSKKIKICIIRLQYPHTEVTIEMDESLIQCNRGDGLI